MKQGFERVITNTLKEISTCIHDLGTYLSRHGMSERMRYRASLVVEEMVANIIRHGYHDARRHEIRVLAEPDRDRLKLVFEDDGIPFDPTLVPDPEPPARLADAPVGGLGIKMVRGVASSMQYERLGDRNRLELLILENAH
jgi:anti-sigma regulatory factor (Ser/Thr protein kinase)